MFSFKFIINDSFMNTGRHPITVPKKHVDYGEFGKRGFGKGEIVIRCPDGSILKGFMYDGVAGYGQYYQLRTYGDPNNLLKQFKISEEIIVKLYKSDQGYFADLFKLPDNNIKFTSIEFEADNALLEGALTKVSLNRYERNAKARMLCVAHYGATCFVCGLSFEEFYGDIGIAYIHVHHLIPISEITQEYEVDPVLDLRPICPNCHSMIHRKYPPLSVEELQDIVRKYNHANSDDAKSRAAD